MWRGTWRGLSLIVYNGHKKYHHIQKIINFALVFYKKVLSKDNRKKHARRSSDGDAVRHRGFRLCAPPLRAHGRRLRQAFVHFDYRR